MTYTEYKISFLKKHDDWVVHTTPMDCYGQYTKVYACADGACMTEINRPYYEDVEFEAEVKGIKVIVRETIKMLETEAWNTDNSKSVKFYEKW